MVEDLGFYTEKAVQELRDDSEYIDFLEGTLLDSFIFYDNKMEKYVLCMEHMLTTWTSCYRVFVEGGSGSRLFSIWDELMDLRQE